MIEVVSGHLVPRAAFIYLTPRSKNGNAPFYSPVKCVGSTEIPTLWYNIIVQLIMALIVAILLYTNAYNKIVANIKKQIVFSFAMLF